jgi:UTP--glucose-1-phosphate uridylyltransferase
MLDSTIKKAVIPAAGLGTRFLPVTKAQPKEMLPVVDKPVIQYVVEEAILAGIEDILIVTGKGKRAIEDHFGKGDGENEIIRDIDDVFSRVNIYYTRQWEPRGLGDAVYHAKSFVGSDPFALLLGDTITMPPCTAEMVAMYEKFGRSIIAVEEVPEDKVQTYGIIGGTAIDEQTIRITDLVEKPSLSEAPSRLGIIGQYILTPAIFDAIDRTEPGFGGEVQLTDALGVLDEEKYAYIYRGDRFDIGNQMDWIKSNIDLFLRDERFAGEMKAYLDNVTRRGSE